MMRMSRIWETSPGSGTKSAGGAWEHPISSVASQGMAKRRLTGLLGVSESQDTSPVRERQPLAVRAGAGSLQAYFLSSLIARSHGDCGVRADRDAAGAGGAHPLPRAAPRASRRLDRGARSAAARTGS